MKQFATYDLSWILSRNSKWCSLL